MTAAPGARNDRSAGTVSWFLGGLALVAAAIWLKGDARLATGLFVGSLYVLAALGNLWGDARPSSWLDALGGGARSDRLRGQQIRRLSTCGDGALSANDSIRGRSGQLLRGSCNRLRAQHHAAREPPAAVSQRLPMAVPIAVSLIWVNSGKELGALRSSERLMLHRHSIKWTARISA
jgi:hypothetical protein